MKIKTLQGDLTEGETTSEDSRTKFDNWKIRSKNYSDAQDPRKLPLLLQTQLPHINPSGPRYRCLEYRHH